jgi:hypothetical protein
MNDFDSSEYYEIVSWQQPYTKAELIAKGERYVAATGLGMACSGAISSPYELGWYMHQQIEPQIRLVKSRRGRPMSVRQRDAMAIAGHLRTAFAAIQKYKNKYKDWTTDSDANEYDYEDLSLLEQASYWEWQRESKTYDEIIRAMEKAFRLAFKTDPSITISEYAGPSGAFWRFVTIAFENAGATISASTVHSAVYRKNT